MKYVFLTTLLASFFSLSAQTHFQKQYSYSDGILLTSAQRTQSGGYIMLGNVGVAGTADNLVIEIDSNADIKWSKTYDGGFGDVTHHILQCNDGGFVIAGDKWNPGNNSTDLTVIKLNDTGKIQWSLAYGGNLYHSAQYIRQTNDGGYIVVGNATGPGIVTSAAFLLKIDSLGAVQWGKTYNATGEIGRSVLEMYDGGFLVAGGSGLFTTNQQNGFLMRTDSVGVPIITKTYAINAPCDLSCIGRTFDGGYLLGGERDLSPNSGIYAGVFLIKTDSLLQLQWSKVFADSFIVGNIPVIRKTNDGNYILGADILDANQSSNILTMKIDELGHIIWSNTMGRVGADFVNCIEQTNDSGYVILGTTNDTANTPRSAYVIKADKFGNSCFTSIVNLSAIDVTTFVDTLNFTISSLDSAETINLTVGGGASGSIVCEDTVATVVTTMVQKDEISIFPNPAHNILTVSSSQVPYKLEILNISGSIVYSESIHTATATIDLKDFSNGIYVFTIYHGSITLHRKVLVR